MPLANIEPFEQVVGPVDVYIAPYVGGTGGEAAPDVDDAPGGNWVAFGNTDGQQTISHPTTVEKLRDNSSPAPSKAHRTEEDKVIKFTLVDTTLENIKYALGTIATVATAAGPPATKTLPSKRDFGLAQYSLLLRGEAHSPYGDYPAQDYTPRCVVISAVERSYGKNRVSVELEFHAVEDRNQSTGDELGWFEAQTG